MEDPAYVLVKWRYDPVDERDVYSAEMFFDDLHDIHNMSDMKNKVEDLQVGDIFYYTETERASEGHAAGHEFYITDITKDVREFPTTQFYPQNSKMASSWYTTKTDINCLTMIDEYFSRVFCAKLACKIFRVFSKLKHGSDIDIVNFIETEYDPDTMSAPELLSAVDSISNKKFSVMSQLVHNIYNIGHNPRSKYLSKIESRYWCSKFSTCMLDYDRCLVPNTNGAIAEFIRSIVPAHYLGVKILEKQKMDLMRVRVYK